MTAFDPVAFVDGMDAEHQRLAQDRLFFIHFIRQKEPLKPCRCSSGPSLILTEGPASEPGSRRKIECGICHQFYFWLPKQKNQQHRPPSSTGLAIGDFCQCCRKIGVSLVGHHVIEVSEGGSNDPENIWTVCEPCHTVIHTLRRIVAR